MKKAFVVLLGIVLLSCGNTPPLDPGNSAKGAAGAGKTGPSEMTHVSVVSIAESGDYRHDELLVKFRSGVVAASSLKAHEAIGARRIRRMSLLNIEQVRLPSGLSLKEAIAGYMRDPNVEYAEPNYLRHVTSLAPSPFIPDDPYFGQQWGLWNTGAFFGGTSGADIRAPYAWSLTAGSRDVVIALLDTGIDYNHPDLQGNIWSNPGEVCSDGLDNDSNGFVDDCRGWNFTTDTNDPLDDEGHGSLVGGIVGAGGNNNAGIAGVMWNVQLMPLKILTAQGVGSVADEVAAINYAVMMKKTKGINIRALNASFGGSDFSNSEYFAISKANDEGMLMIAAAGNGDRFGIGLDDDNVPEYPASYDLPNIISVAATDPDDILASFSNFGLESVDVAAPGVFILSALSSAPDIVPCTTEAGHPGYDTCSGTSFSVPFVTGLVGLLSTEYPNFSAEQIRGTILRYVDVLPSLENRISSGGRIDAFKAVSSLLPPTDVTATGESATSVTVTWTDNATGEDGYTLERSTAGGSFSAIASLAPESTSYTDTTVSANTTYTYRVTAFNTLPATSNSAETSVTTPAPPPPPVDQGGGGGGCSLGGHQNLPSALANTAVLLLPLFVLLIAGSIRRRRRR